MSPVPPPYGFHHQSRPRGPRADRFVHYMEAAVPDRIVEELKAVIAKSWRRVQTVNAARNRSRARTGSPEAQPSRATTPR